MGGPEIERLIALLAKLPGLGPRSARRAALKMLQQPEARMLPLATALAEAARAVKPCRLCGNLDSRIPARSAPTRSATARSSASSRASAICGRWSAPQVHHGLYHVLGGTLSALAGMGPEDLNVTPLLRADRRRRRQRGHPRAAAPRSTARPPRIG